MGGAVRDGLLGRPTTDFDVAYAGDPSRLARAFARIAKAHPFALSETFGAWRVVARDHSWQLDVTPLAGETIEDDLGQRDLTINAIAQSRRRRESTSIRSTAIGDLRRRALRMVSPDAFERDPLRTLRLARLACELEFDDRPADRGRGGGEWRGELPRWLPSGCSRS